jgi:hypothetical protein
MILLGRFQGCSCVFSGRQEPYPYKKKKGEKKKRLLFIVIQLDL